jgi:hypothetical protein
MSALRRVLLAFLAFSLMACGQKIVVIDCDAGTHDDGGDLGDGTMNGTDGSTGGDVAPGADAGMSDGNDKHGDASGGDGSTGDGGSVSCANAPYCIRMLTASKPKANVREAVTFAPTIDNPENKTLTFRVDMSEIRTSRRAALPAAHVSDLSVSLLVDQTGVATFTVNDVPTWYATTNFTIRLHASQAGGPDVYAEAAVAVRGNVLASDNAVYAITSDGHPAHSVNFSQGELISGSSFIQTPRAMTLAQDGTLIVFDIGVTPPRPRRFDLSGENVGLGDFASMDAMSMPLIPADNMAGGLTQLMDGRFALVIYSFSRTTDSAIVLWKSDGMLDRVLNATNPTVHWQSVAGSQTTNELLVLEDASAGRLIRLNPDTGAELGIVATDIAIGRSVRAMPDGNAYVGISGAILRVTPQGGKSMVSMLPGASSDYWNSIDTYSDGRIIAGSDASSDTQGIVIIDGTTFTGNLRAMNVSNPTIEAHGLVYLE